MADVTERTRTVFEAVGVSRYQQSMGAVGAAAGRAGSVIRSTTGLLRPFNMVLGALGVGGGMMAVRSLVRMNEGFHEMQQRLAGTFQAFGHAKNFTAGMALAATTIEQVRKQTMTLPGPTAEYVEAVKQLLPVVQGSLGGTTESMVKFSTRSLEAFNAMGVGAMGAASAMQRMLMPDKGMMSARMEGGRQLLLQMKQLKGHADLTFKSFNEMTAPQRALLLTAALDKMSPTVLAMRNDFGGMSSTVHKTVLEMLRTASTPLFEHMERAMRHVRDLLVDANGNLTPFANHIVDVGKNISDHIGRALDWVLLKMEYLGKHWDQMKTRIERAGKALAALYVANKLGLLGGGGAGGGAGLLGGGAKMLQSAWGAGMAAQTAAMLVPSAMDFLKTERESALSLAMAGTFATGPARGISSLATPAAMMFASSGPAMAATITTTSTALSAATMVVAKGMGLLLKVLGPLGLAATIAWSGIELYKVNWRELFDYIGDEIKGLKMPFGDFFAGLANDLRIFGNDMRETFHISVPGPTGPAKKMETSPLLDMIANRLKDPLLYGKVFDKYSTAAKIGRQAFPGLTNLPTPKPYGPTEGPTIEQFQSPKPFKPLAGLGGAKVVQDFRNSRFNIEQKFAEGYDPDRVAVAFSKDIGRIGEQRLQSAYEPMFAVR